MAKKASGRSSKAGSGNSAPSGPPRSKRQPVLSPAGAAEADARKRRLADALRKNLRRRKAQMAARGKGD